MTKIESLLGYAEQTNHLITSCHPRRQRQPDLPYGWIKANFHQLQRRFGSLRHVALSSIYPRPEAEWKKDRSFLMDKWVHDIDFLRYLLGDFAFVANCLTDDYDHYRVEVEAYVAGRSIKVDCSGTRLHGAKGEFVEFVTLNFANGDCVIYPYTGKVRLFDKRSKQKQEIPITRMSPAAYNRIFHGLMADFAAAIDGGPRTHTNRDLWVVAESAVELAIDGKLHTT